MAAASSASLKLMRAEIKFLPPSPRRAATAAAPFVLSLSLPVARSLGGHGRETSGWRLMVEHHVNKFGPRRRTEGCLLLIFGLRAASKESTWRGGETPGLAFRQRCLAYTRIAPSQKKKKTTSQRSSLDQMRNRCVPFLCLPEFLLRREPARGAISSGEITTVDREPSAKSRARGDRERVRSIYED